MRSQAAPGPRVVVGRGPMSCGGEYDPIGMCDPSSCVRIRSFVV